MSTTTYTLVDFINVLELSSNYVACSTNSRTPPNALFSGLLGGAYSTTGITSYSDQVTGNVLYLWDLDHTTPSIPVPVNALITKVTIQQQVNDLAAISDISGTLTGAATPSDNNGHESVNSHAQIFPDVPIPQSALWVTSENRPNLTDSDSAVLSPVFNLTSAAGPLIRLIEIIYDFTLNPNGDFPLGYCSYADFITNFTTYSINYDTQGICLSAFANPPGPAGVNAGSRSNSVGVDTANLTIFVEWSMPSSWVIDDTTKTLPDDVISISSPTPLPLKSITVGNTVIEPNDPWVIVWTDVLIEIHLPPDETDDPTIKVEVIGTEFSGSIPIGTLTVTTADLSGIYQLDITAHSDTLYDRSSGISTQEVAIPAPYLSTYFIDDKETDVLHYTGTRMRVTGQGLLHQVFQSLDYVHTELFGDLTLVTAGNLNPFSLANFIDQQCSLRVYTTTLNDFMNVSQIIVFSKQLFTGYPQ